MILLLRLVLGLLLFLKLGMHRVRLRRYRKRIGGFVIFLIVHGFLGVGLVIALTNHLSV